MNAAAAKSVFLDALERTGEARERFVEEACAGDEAMAARVRALLAAHERAGASRFLEEGARVAQREAGADGEGPIGERRGDAVGGWTIEERIGEGGFGVVYRARQDEPVRREGALKIIRLGMDTERVVARFEVERQAMALMDHPSIARVLDAGVTGDGRPFFVMELVDGAPVTAWCDARRLTVRERLALFERICLAVHHAHQRGVIHRDLKPANVLVTEVDGAPLPKVIDFGVAKAVAEAARPERTLTQDRQIVGTPAYMSPEQAALAGGAVDTRTDIYALGVLLHELLIGRTPLASEDLRSVGAGDLTALIRRSAAVRPSARLSGDGASLDRVAAARSTDPGRLRRAVRGDLDNIVRRAIDEDPDRRYPSAFALARDVRRRLEGRPVEAARPSAAYRLRRFIGRNKAGSAAAAAVLLALVVGAAVAGAALVEAGRQARVASAVNAFLNEDLLASVAPEAQGRDVLMRDVLDAASARIESASGSRLAGQPRVEAAIRRTLGRTYVALGEYEPAERHLRRAAALYEREAGRDDPTTLITGSELARVLKLRDGVDEALALYESLIARARGAGADEALVDLINGLAGLHYDEGDLEAAEREYREALRLARERLGDGHPLAVTVLGNLGTLYNAQGLARFDEAERLLREAVAGHAALRGEDHPDTLALRHNLASVLEDVGRYDEAAPIYEQVLSRRREMLGDRHPETVNTLNNLGLLYMETEAYDRAEPLLREAMETAMATLGEAHPSSVRAAHNLAAMLAYAGRLEEAEPLRRRSVELAVEALGPEHPNALAVMSSHADLLNRLGRYEEALAVGDRTLEAGRRVLPAGHWRLGTFLLRRGESLEGLGREAEAAEAMREAREVFTSTLGPEHHWTTDAAAALSRVRAGAR